MTEKTVFICPPCETKLNYNGKRDSMNCLECREPMIKKSELFPTKGSEHVNKPKFNKNTEFVCKICEEVRENIELQTENKITTTIVICSVENHYTIYVDGEINSGIERTNEEDLLVFGGIIY